MSHIIHSLNITLSQKIVMMKILMAPQGRLGKRIQFSDEKEATARDVLAKLGLITYDPTYKYVNITQNGMTLMQEVGLVDETGMASEEGKQLISRGAQQTTEGTNTRTFKQFLITR